MGLQTLKFLHIGDIHWPGLQSSKADIDSQDEGFPPAITTAIASTKVSAVLRRLARAVREQDGILLSGDVTDRSDLVSYRECLAKLRGLFGTDLNKVHIVSGNHDIDRTLCVPRSSQRFECLNAILKDLKYGPMPEEQSPVFEEVKRGTASALIVALNSCMGCGFKRYVNYLGSADAGNSIDAMLKAGDQRVYEDLDTPAFPEDQLREAYEKVSTYDLKTIPIVLAHHNLLPQTTPRTSPYGELINGGRARMKLALLSRPVIYLHGHIHSDPLEVIGGGDSRVGVATGTKIVSIAAPTLESGFNEVKIEFNSRGYPLGCVIVRWRYSSSQEMIPSAETVPFFGDLRSARSIITPLALTLLKSLFGQSQSAFRMRDLMQMTNADMFNTALSVSELKWYSTIQIDDEQQEPEAWTVRKVIA